MSEAAQPQKVPSVPQPQEKKGFRIECVGSRLGDMVTPSPNSEQGRMAPFAIPFVTIDHFSHRTFF